MMLECSAQFVCVCVCVFGCEIVYRLCRQDDGQESVSVCVSEPVSVSVLVSDSVSVFESVSESVSEPVFV
jgi:hypothetical protein